MKIPYWKLAFGPAILFVLGFLMNAIVVADNSGTMPVLVHNCTQELMGEDDDLHVCMGEEAHLKILADWILWNHVGVFSPGDFLEIAGELTFNPFLIAWLAFVIRDYNRRGIDGGRTHSWWERKQTTRTPYPD
jgi:hypothetical protein